MDAGPRSKPLGDLAGDAEWLSGLAARLVRDGALADDACQDAWSRGLEAGRAPSRAELAYGVRRYLSGHWRGARRRARREEAVARREAVPAADEVVLQSELLRALADAIEALEEPLRSTLVARFHGGLEVSAIAERFGVPPDTVRWRIREGIARLRRFLDRRGVLGVALLPRVESPEVALPLASAGAFTTTVLAMKTALLAVAAALALVWFLVPKTAETPREVARAEPPAGPPAELEVLADVPVPVPRSLGATEDVAAVLRDLPPAPPPPPPGELTIQLVTEPGVQAPTRATVHVLGLREGVSDEIERVEVDAAEVVDGAIEVALTRKGDPRVASIGATEVSVRASGFTAAVVLSESIVWEGGSPSTVTVELQRAASILVQAIDGRTGEPFDHVMYAVVGATELFGGVRRRDGTEPFEIAVPAEGAEDDWLFAAVPGGTVAGRGWRLVDVVRLPPTAAGVRRLELLPGAVIEGRVARDDGLPLEEGVAVHHATRLGDGGLGLAYPHWASRDGIAKVAPDGSFRIEGVVTGTCVLELRTAGNIVEATSLAPARLVEVEGDATEFVDWTVASDYDELVLDLEWHTSSETLLFFDLFAEPGEAPEERRLLATRHFVLPRSPLPVRLARGTLVPGARYVLRIGNNLNSREDYTLTVEGSRVALRHDFVADGAGTPLAARPKKCGFSSAVHRSIRQGARTPS